ncbi:MAG: hypothetical protein HKP61_19835 [Dactylosporangium sp.]|nr:hypothetical protein [Dactylosporangium sp.]NNJ63136.1 hypothetical protein [Dactylosporangium sp.]
MRQPVMVYVDPREDPVTVTSTGELDRVLDRLAADPRHQQAPPLVEIVSIDEHRVLDIGLAHPDLSVVCWYDNVAGEALSSVATAPAASSVAFRLGGVWTMPDRSAVPVSVARQAAREFAVTGARPTVVSWQPLPSPRSGR